MNILVTGGAGFIGSHVVDAYLKAGHTVAVLDNLTTGKRSNLPADVKIFEVDISDLAAVTAALHEFKPEVINHHAAQISVTHSVEEPQFDAQQNIIGTINILEAIRTLSSFKKIIYASSGGAMYGEAKELPIPETATAQPMSPYGLTKYVAEQYVWLYHRLYDLNATVLRYSNVYGPRQDPHGEAGVCAIFAERMVKGQPVTIFGDGSATRDYVYVGDVAAANLLILDKGDNHFFNICTCAQVSTQQVFDELKEVFQHEHLPEYAPSRPGELQSCALSLEKAQQTLGWAPKYDFHHGIQETAAWYQQRGETHV